MSYTVKELLGGRVVPVTIGPNEFVTTAQERMLEGDFSQLPVVDEDGIPVGMITGASVLRAISHCRASLDQLRVRDALADRFVTYEEGDDLFDLLDNLVTTNAVLIMDGQKRLTGIVTSYDTTEYFRRRAEDIMVVEDIEDMLKDFIASSHVTDSGAQDEASLTEAIGALGHAGRKDLKRFHNALGDYLGNEIVDQTRARAAFEQHLAGQPPQKKKSLDELTLFELNELFLNQRCWSRLEASSSLGNKEVRNLLDAVREIRNTLMHFREPLSAKQRDKLQFCSTWLGRQINLVTSLPSRPGGLPNQVVATGRVEVGEGDSNASPAPVDEERRAYDGRYAPLGEHLRGVSPSVREVALSFADVERVLQARLPDSARHHRTWWANTQVHNQARTWLDAGWQISRVNLDAGQVSFIRRPDRARAYDAFYDALLAALRKQASFQVGSPTNKQLSWIRVAGAPHPGPQVGILGFAFTVDRRFRAELYIDTHDKERNKAIFDALHAQRAEIEAQVGEPLAWERIDDKQACRVALYRKGSIDDPPGTFEELRAWGVEKMVRLEKALNPRLVEWNRQAQ